MTIRAATPVHVVWRRGDAFVAVRGNLVGVRWTGVPASDQLRALAEAHALAARGNDDVLLLNDVVRIAGPARVDAQVHAQMRALVERCRGRTHAVAHAIELPGPVGSVVRAFLEALERITTDGRVRTATFDDPDAAAAWLARVGGKTAPDPAIASTWRAMEQAAAPALAA